MSIVAERMKKILNKLDLQASSLAEELGITKSAMSKITLGKVKELSGSVVELLRLKYNINPTWLQTGEGEMFLQPQGLPGELGNLPPDVQDVIKLLLENPDWARATRNVLKGGEVAIDYARTFAELPEKQRLAIMQMIQSFQHG
jgi:transcriptional regulator with XRE-family HTH domain